MMKTRKFVIYVSLAAAYTSFCSIFTGIFVRRNLLSSHPKVPRQGNWKLERKPIRINKSDHLGFKKNTTIYSEFAPYNPVDPLGDWYSTNNVVVNKSSSKSSRLPQVTPRKPLPTFSRLMQPMYMILRGRTGNNMFQIAALLTFCWRTGHRPVLTDSFRLQRLLSAFPVVQGMLELGPMPRNAVTLTERGAYIFDVECSHRMHANKSVIIDGYFQSWKYLQGYEDAIGKVFTLDESYVTEAKHMLLNISTQVASSRRTSAGQITIVAIHVRRGDIALARGVYQVGSLTYLQRAMDYFRGRYTEVQFVVCSDTAFWSEGKLRGDDIHTRMSTRHWALDMALLVLADHVILTVGSFGWWGAWLGRGQREVIYYDQPFRQDSVKAAEFRAADFYPSSWKPMGD